MYNEKETFVTWAYNKSKEFQKVVASLLKDESEKKVFSTIIAWNIYYKRRGYTCFLTMLDYSDAVCYLYLGEGRFHLGDEAFEEYKDYIKQYIAS